MAAPNKKELDYFPLYINIDINEKVSMIIAEFGLPGEVLYTKLISWAYGHQGYFVVWDEATKLQFNRRYMYCNFSVKWMDLVIQKLIKWDLFHADTFKRFGILTSCRLQETWKEITRKRINRTYRHELWLIPDVSGLIPEETTIKTEQTDKGKERETERKKKETVLAGEPAPSDENLSKGIGKAAQDTPPPNNPKQPRPKFTPPTLDEVETYFKQKAGSGNNVNSWIDAQCKVEAYAMFNHYESKGWKVGKVTMVSWKASANNWILNVKKGTFAKTEYSGKPKSGQAAAGPAIVKPTAIILTPAQKSINYSYERYCEGPELITVQSLEATYWNEIAKAGLFNPTPDDRQQLKEQAATYLTEKGKPVTPEAQDSIAKKLAVLEFFKRHHAAGNIEVFTTS